MIESEEEFDELDRGGSIGGSLLRSYREALDRHYNSGDYKALGMWVQDNEGALQLALGGIPRSMEGSSS